MFRSQILSLGLLVLIIASVCHGQVSDDQFPRVPKRIGVSEFYGYVDRLQLSDAQQLEADRAYDEYLASFEPLRDEMIELLRQHPGGSMSIVEQDGIIGHLPALCERMQAIDNTLIEWTSAVCLRVACRRR